MNKNQYIAIMAGGVGSRFWPASRENRPKQFLDILGVGRSLIQLTYDRACRIVPSQNILIVSNQAYRELIMEQLPELSEDQLLLEPSRNNTAPCVAYTALHLRAKQPEAVFAMLPSDHVILKEETFITNMKTALNEAALQQAIFTLGIAPTRPDTGYGYINYEKGAQNSVCKVLQFKEKPDKVTAQQYLDGGDYLWNAGIFIWSVPTILSAFQQSCPDILSTLCEDNSHFGTPAEQEYINKVYPQTQNISVDFAILEHAKNVYTIPSDIGWSDLGTWNSLYAYLDKDNEQNVSIGKHIQQLDSSGNIVRSAQHDKLLIIKGLKNYIIIDDDNVLLIYPREEEQNIKALRENYKGTDFV